MTYRIVGNNAISSHDKVARYFPSTIFQEETGLVNNISSVAVCLSSAKLLIVKAGMRKMKIMGAIANSESTLANGVAIKLKSGNTHSTNPRMANKRPSVMYAIMELK
jgi:hypothetical protein